MNELTVITKDHVGLLAEVSELLGKKKINIESLHADASRGTAILRLYTESPAKAKAALKGAGFEVMDSAILVIRVDDKPGKLARVARILSDNGINMKNLYLLKQDKSEKLFAIETTDNDAARKALKDYV